LDGRSARRKAANYTGQHKHRKSRHPCFLWDSNSRSQVWEDVNISCLTLHGHRARSIFCCPFEMKLSLSDSDIESC
jgi:hypothetical protein